ncbi:MAG TPA: metallophosphoesterase [Myxococcaceae bacterium]|nr:metallophosphoesterase [Myxococcaceae bacterium]
MAHDLYNFIWVTKPVSPPVALSVGMWTMNTVALQSPVEAVIVFPALMTPLVYVTGQEHEDGWLELLIATRKPELRPESVNLHLKIASGLDPAKKYSHELLFPQARGNIEVKSLGEVPMNGEAIVQTHSRFRGVLHHSFVSALFRAACMQLHQVRVRFSAVVPARAAKDPCSHFEQRLTGYRLSGGNPAAVSGHVLVGDETSDVLIRDMLANDFDEQGNETANPIPGHGRYAFPVEPRGANGARDVDLSRIDPSCPIQSYHPLVVLSGEHANAYLSWGFLSDIHVNSRLQLLARSTARVIEYGDKQLENESPPIGTLLAETNTSFQEVLDNLCRSRADVLIVGGDVVDHIRNAYSPACSLATHPTPSQIWKAVSLDDEAYTSTSYPRGLDLVAFYSFIFDAIRHQQKPIFAISGNHDCYEDAFGISPRLLTSRTNEGIPADLNLTFYEALLAFGPTAGMLRKLGSSFDNRWFSWFHLILTPFRDWWFQFPKQSLVGVGWGDSECIIKPQRGADGMFHFPTSGGFTDGQYELLKAAVQAGDSHRVTLATHFTLLSYDPSLSNRDFTKQQVWLTGHDKNTQGSFDERRGEVIEKVTQRKIQCILSGHTHRRGLYFVNADETPRASPDGSVVSVDFCEIEPKVGDTPARVSSWLARVQPAIVVSDSAGPYPRHNRFGEFQGWGSDKPSGTLVEFDAAGAIHAVTAVQATRRPAPRAAVAMDYLDLVEEGVFNAGCLETLGVVPAHAVLRYSDEPVWYIRTAFSPKVDRAWCIRIEQLVLAARHKDRWIRILTTYDATRDAFSIAGPQTGDFLDWTEPGPDRFLSLKLRSEHPYLGSHYDWGHWWNFEARALRTATLGRLPGDPLNRALASFLIFRPQRELQSKGPDVEWREAPDFKSRAATLPEKYG